MTRSTMKAADENLHTTITRFMETYAEYKEGNANGADTEAAVDQLVDALPELRRAVRKLRKQVKKEARENEI